MKDIFKDRESIMKQWDKWRKYIAEGGGGSWPRDSFESLLDCYDEKLNASQCASAGDALAESHFSDMPEFPKIKRKCQGGSERP